MERISEQRTSLLNGQANATAVIQNEDIPILIGIRDATFIGSQQLRHMLACRKQDYTRDQVKYRLSRLANAGLLNVHPQVATVRGQNYSITRYGLSCLESLGHALVSISSDSEHLADPVQIVHALTLNELMIRFYATGAVTLWLTDRLVRDRNVVSTSPFSKDYDAVSVLTKLDGSKHAVGLEYERSLKSRERYVDIKQRLVRESRLAILVYFVAIPAAIPVIAGALGKLPNCRVLYVSMLDFRTAAFAASAHYLKPTTQENKLISTPLQQALSLPISGGV